MTDSRHELTFIALGAISLVVWWKACLATFTLAFYSEEYSHVLLILPISAALIFLRRRALLGSARFDVAMGLPILALAISGSLWANPVPLGLMPDAVLSISMLALVTWWIGAVVLCFGTRVFQALKFPMLFLFWLVPLPDLVLGRIVAALQQTSASLTYLMFVSAGVPVGKDGVVLSIPGLSIEVAKECSSIRSSLILFITSMVLADLLLRSAWRKGLVILLTIPLSVAKNAVRIFTLSMLATHVDPGFLTGRLHRQGGVVFFSLAVVALWFLIFALQDRSVEHRRKLFRRTRAIQQAIGQ